MGNILTGFLLACMVVLSWLIFRKILRVTVCFIVLCIIAREILRSDLKTEAMAHLTKSEREIVDILRGKNF